LGGKASIPQKKHKVQTSLSANDDLICSLKAKAKEISKEISAVESIKAHAATNLRHIESTLSEVSRQKEALQAREDALQVEKQQSLELVGEHDTLLERLVANKKTVDGTIKLYRE